MNQRRSKLIFRKVRDANLKYHLVENGDRIAVAMSGGKDSLALLYFLDMLLKYTPLRFEILPIYLDLGFGNQTAPLVDFCQQLGYELREEKSNIGRVVFDTRQESNPCALCANLRRGAIHRLARREGCNKVALGHHLDDAVHTLMLSILFQGRFQLFKPLTYLDRMDITLIRPLVYVSERDIALFIAGMGFSPVQNLCPASGYTRRSDVADLLDEMEKRFPGARRQLLKSIENADPNSFWN
jgi:tRNA 2-thiocytidine biosynthesis protein TtcA